ncbi:signal peptidase I [Flavobacterium orientale]|uniref:Signal peptidase I n=1 Tax=Flavobacterium orientale TaxID=1756020 RepID=A0A917DD87_9FLAO|nr:signal peptidase I [Flavobacterium orientale]GGD30621.1 hypothetical protein GCM10011343_20970 [Flavobacterium orientale]
MNKNLKKIVIIVGVCFVTYQFLGFFGIFKIYNNPTVANEPNLKQGTKFMATNTREPEIGDFVCYKYGDSLFGSNLRVHRLCAIENDLVEIKNGVLYVNGTNKDKDFKLLHFYAVNNVQYEKLKLSNEYEDNKLLVFGYENERFIALEESFALKMGLKRSIEPENKTDNSIERRYGKKWNKDNFGPLKIPIGKIFVLGDNRDNSEDSRYIGVIDVSDIKGVVLNK